MSSTMHLISKQDAKRVRFWLAIPVLIPALAVGFATTLICLGSLWVVNKIDPEGRW